MWFCFPGLTVGIIAGLILGSVGCHLMKCCCGKKTPDKKDEK